MGLQAHEKLSKNTPAFRPGALYQGLASAAPIAYSVTIPRIRTGKLPARAILFN
jgi:hypothetical protein